MKSWAETVYAHIPVWGQNCASSLYGLREEWIRHQGNYRTHFREAMARYSFDSAELKKYTNIQLKALVSEAAQNVPYYRQLFKRLKLRAETIEQAGDLSKLPLLCKEIIRKDYESLIHERYSIDRLLCIHTTGTTGTPLRIFCDKNTRQLNYAYYDRFLSVGGLNHKGKRATFGGRIVVPQTQRRPPFWRYSLAQKNLLFSSYHLTDSFLPFYVEKLIDFRPDIIDAYPSSLFALARYAESNAIDLHGIVNGITTSAETLFPEQRRVIESVFGVSVLDQYGAAEMCMFVGQCKEGSYHVHSDYGILELLKDDGTPANPGEEAELVCTGFVNRIMPLIRYRIGDRGILSAKKCECGNSFPVLDKILGRMDDVLVTPEGRMVGRLSPVFKGFPVKEVQYIQRVTNAVEVLVVKDIGYSNETEKYVLEELRKRLGQQILIVLKYCEAIPRGNGGKLRSVVSHVGNASNGRI